ncbi:MAG: putative bifunctional diguanylate cyclase/phosphodiesterase [Oscillospiraceae bacterium]
MIRNIYAGTLIAIIAVIVFCCIVIVRKDRSALGKCVRNLMITASLTIAAYTFAIIVPNRQIAAATYGFYYFASDILLIGMVIYSRQYIGLVRKGKPVIIAMLIISLADAVMMIMNVFTGDVFTCDADNDATGARFFGVTKRGELYNLHRFFVICLVAVILILLGWKIFTCAKTYRYKYIAVFATVVIIITVNIISLQTHFALDFSLAFYGLTALTIFYFRLYYVPRELIQGIQLYVMKNMNDGVLCMDEAGNAVYANDQARRLYRVEPNGKLTVINAFFEDWLDGRKVEDIGEISWKERIDGRSYDTQFKPLYDNRNILIGCFFIQHDETEQLAQIEAERYRATHDSLTGLYNKEHFYECVSQLLADKEDNTYCMVCSDIKDFKLLNDIFGVETGDMVLKHNADIIRQNDTKTTVFGRLSGDKFALCLPAQAYNEALLRRHIDELSHIVGNAYTINLQMGVYFISDNSIEPSIMCDRAFMAIKAIKDSYTESIGHYDDSLRDRIIAEQQLTSAFSTALAEQQFTIFIQPQVAADGRKVLGGEALVRWNHPERGLVPPMEFIPIFERTGLVCELDMYIWELACRKLAEWKKEGRTNYHISVNISPKDFYFTDIFDTFTGLVERYEISPENLRLEITETAMMSDFQSQLALIERLREYGFKIEMDDFGSGYSSLNMLKDISVDTLKIDMAFLRQTENNERSRAILRAIIMLSKQLGIEVITEGVETLEQVEYLTEFGSDVFQGYYFARPMPVEEFENKYLYADGF